MTCSELVRMLDKDSPSYLLRHGSSHDIWFNPETGKKFSVPRHPSGEIKTKTAENILKDAGYKKKK